VATSSGHVVLWQYCPYKGKSIGPRLEPADYWDLIIVTAPVTGFISQIRVCSSVCECKCFGVLKVKPKNFVANKILKE